MKTITIRPFAALKLLTLACLALVLLLLNGCHWVGVHGNGHLTTDARPVTEFSRVEADGAFDLKWTTGAPALRIRTDENLMDYIHTTISGDKLRIEWVKPLRGTHGIKIEIASRSLNRVQLNGAVRFNASNLSGTEFYLEGNGATRITVQGAVNAVSAELNGASRLDADELTTRAMELSISGAGRAEVNVSEALKVDISGAGKVIYSGHPKTVDKSISGAGSIRPKD